MKFSTMAFILSVTCLACIVGHDSETARISIEALMIIYSALLATGITCQIAEGRANV